MREISNCLTKSAELGNLSASVSPNVNPPPFSHVCARISAELIALDCERGEARIEDPEYRAFLAGLFRMALDKPCLDDWRPGARERFSDLIECSVSGAPRLNGDDGDLENRLVTRPND